MAGGPDSLLLHEKEATKRRLHGKHAKGDSTQGVVNADGKDEIIRMVSIHRRGLGFKFRREVKEEDVRVHRLLIALIAQIFVSRCTVFKNR